MNAPVKPSDVAGATRRDVVIGAAVVGGALVVGACSPTDILSIGAKTDFGAFGPFIKIGADGAVTVVSGALVETRWDGGALRQRRLDAGDQAGFPLGWVHDVVWAPSKPARITSPTPTPTLSVHAYSPPLTAMSYYEVTDRNTLKRDRTELTDKPEGD